jgi:hypothetical protein
MTLAQELSNAAGDSDLLTLALAAIAFAGMLVREVIGLITKLRTPGEQSNGELSRRLDRLEKEQRGASEGMQGVIRELGIVRVLLDRSEKK